MPGIINHLKIEDSRNNNSLCRSMRHCLATHWSVLRERWHKASLTISQKALIVYQHQGWSATTGGPFQLPGWQLAPGDANHINNESSYEKGWGRSNAHQPRCGEAINLWFSRRSLLHSCKVEFWQTSEWLYSVINCRFKTRNLVKICSTIMGTVDGRICNTIKCIDRICLLVSISALWCGRDGKGMKFVLRWIF